MHNELELFTNHFYRLSVFGVYEIVVATEAYLA